MADGQTIAVVGATGMLGEPVARRLHADGFRVRVLVRAPERARQRFGEGFEIVPGDVERPATLSAALEGCHGVHVSLAGGPEPDSFDRIEHRGTAEVAAAAAKAGLRRITYLSGASVSESTAWYPGTRAKLDAEAAIRASGVPYTVFRATWFMESLPLFVRGSKATSMGKQPHTWHWIAANDYARMVATAYRTTQAENRILYVHGPEALRIPEALEFYCARVHPGVKVSSVPLWLIGIVARLGRNAVLANVVRLMRYFEIVREAGDPEEANALLGGPSTTLAQWCEEQKASRASGQTGGSSPKSSPGPGSTSARGS
jgi:uncharacterized protein YbjT (DUF2867 family)